MQVQYYVLVHFLSQKYFLNIIEICNYKMILFQYFHYNMFLIKQPDKGPDPYNTQPRGFQEKNILTKV